MGHLAEAEYLRSTCFTYRKFNMTAVYITAIYGHFIYQIQTLYRYYGLQITYNSNWRLEWHVGAIFDSKI